MADRHMHLQHKVVFRGEALLFTGKGAVALTRFRGPLCLLVWINISSEFLLVDSAAVMSACPLGLNV